MKRESTEASQNICRARRIAGTILTVIAVVFTVYLSVIMIHRIYTVAQKTSYIAIFATELILCAAMIFFSYDIRTGIFSRGKSTPGKIIGWILRVLAAFLTALTLFLTGKVITGGMIHDAADAKYAVVLGLALNDGKPADDLILRLDTAKEYLDAHPDSLLVLTGGNPGNDGRTEAAVMRDLLSEKGVPDEKMNLEDKASNTVGNFRNTANIIGTDEPIALITSDYHIDRAADTARKAGFNNIARVPAKSEFLLYGANVMWEVVADILAVFI